MAVARRMLVRIVALAASAACARGGAGAERTPGAPAAAVAAKAMAGRVDTFRLAMPELGGRERTIRVYLPPGYDDRGPRRPVLYLQDAQNLFTAGAYGDWRVDETLDSLAAGNESRSLIVVGVDNSQHRWEEYGPWANDRMHAWVASSWAKARQGGEGADYVRWLAGTLKPEIDRRYRTLPGSEQTGIGGSSMGGLIALYAGLLRPDVFSKVMAMSTAVWFAEGTGPWLADNRLLGAIRSAPAPRSVRFYLDVGTNERSRDTDPDVVDASGKPVTYARAYLEGSRAAADALRAAGVPDSNLRFVAEDGAIHHETAWARRLPGALRWLYR